MSQTEPSKLTDEKIKKNLEKALSTKDIELKERLNKLAILTTMRTTTITCHLLLFLLLHHHHHDQRFSQTYVIILLRYFYQI